MAQTEGIILDPIYTGKCFAALLDHIGQGLIPKDSNVVFIHTGGTPAIFSHATELLHRLDTSKEAYSAQNSIAMTAES